MPGEPGELEAMSYAFRGCTGLQHEVILTFAFPVSKRLRIPGKHNQQGKAITDYDPYA
jgi:hypothetical protein